MARAIFNGEVIAESGNTVIMEGNHYFPPDSVKPEYLADSAHQTVCPHKGTASYKDVVVNGERAENAAWVYPDVNGDYAKSVEGHYAFWNGVTVES